MKYRGRTRIVATALGLCALAGAASLADAQLAQSCQTYNFDDGTAQGFTFTTLTNTNLWHVTAGCGAGDAGHSLPNALYYGQEGSCNYDTGEINSAAANAPAIPVTGGQAVSLTVAFNYLRAAESGEQYDKTQVQYSTDNGSSWNTMIDSGSLQNDDAWHAITHTLSAVSIRSSLLVRFVFDTIDAADNDTTGWMVDDVSICTGPALSVPMLDRTALGLLALMLGGWGAGLLWLRRR
jgi:hypothetical protein